MASVALNSSSDRRAFWVARYRWRVWLNLAMGKRGSDLWKASVLTRLFCRNWNASSRVRITSSSRDQRDADVHRRRPDDCEPLRNDGVSFAGSRNVKNDIFVDVRRLLLIFQEEQTSKFFKMVNNLFTLGRHQCRSATEQLFLDAN